MTLFGWDARVPLITSAPGFGKGGAKSWAISELIDILPTLTDLSGPPSPPQLVGQELYDAQTDPLETVNQARTIDTAAVIPAFAEQLDALVK
jgi:arylsulfatase A-like enzyme